MGKASSKAAVYSTWLRGQMRQHDLSNRALGKRTDPEDPERGRRRVQRHLSGKHFPSAASRRVYLDVFGLEGDPFTDDDAEEDDLAATLSALVREQTVLSRRITRVLRAVQA